MFATHQEFQTVLCSILKNFLNCVEELRTLNGNIPQVLKDIRSVTGTRHPVDYSLIPSVRPPVSPSELTVKHNSLFDTLSSSGESANVLTSRVMSRFPLALSPKTKKTRSYTSCESTHVTSGVNTRQTPSNLTGIRTMETTAWQLDALSSRDRRGSGRRGLSRRSGRVDI
jgi:hypothetical protein